MSRRRSRSNKINRQQAQNYNARGVSRLAWQRGGYDRHEIDSQQPWDEPPRAWPDWRPDEDAEGSSDAWRQWWPEPGSTEDDEWARESMAVVEQVARRLMAENGVPADSSLALDLGDYLIESGIRFRNIFVPPAGANMPPMWFGSLHKALRKYGEYHLLTLRRVGAGGNLAWTTTSAEAATELVAGVWEANVRENLRIKSLDLMPPEPHYLLMEAIAERVDPRTGPPKDPALCTAFGCQRSATSTGWCTRHNQIHWETWGDDGRALCKEEGCGSYAIKGAWCRYHYERQRKDQIRAGTWEPTQPLDPSTPCISCGKPVGAKQAKGLCGACYQRERLAQAPLCTVEGCEKPQMSRGLCSKHYQRQKLAQAPACSIEGCEKPQVARGLCKPHYKRWKKKQKEADGE